MVKYQYVLLLVLCQLYGCSSIDPYYPAPSEHPSGPEAEPPTTPSQPQNNVSIEPARRQPALSDSAVNELLNQAKAFHQAGNYQRSVAVAERAMRLDRHEPNIYLILAANYFALKEFQQAERLARQGLPLANGEYLVESHFRRLLEEIRKVSQE